MVYLVKENDCNMYYAHNMHFPTVSCPLKFPIYLVLSFLLALTVCWEEARLYFVTCAWLSCCTDICVIMLQDIIWHACRENCTAKMVQRTAFSSPYYGMFSSVNLSVYMLPLVILWECVFFVCHNHI